MNERETTIKAFKDAYQELTGKPVTLRYYRGKAWVGKGHLARRYTLDELRNRTEQMREKIARRKD